MQTGDRVEFQNYGKTEQGIITRIGRNGTIVFVLVKSTQRGKWLHAESVSLIKGD